MLFDDIGVKIRIKRSKNKREKGWFLCLFVA
jgi:hypothetical protein